MAYVDFVNPAIELCKKGAAADEAEKYPEALKHYKQAVEFFTAGIKHEKNPAKLEMLRSKAREILERAEQIKKYIDSGGSPASPSGGGAAMAKKKADDKDEDTEESSEGAPPEPLTKEQLQAAQDVMEEQLKKLVGMQDVKQRMRDVCKQEMHDITRAAAGQSINKQQMHMIFTGNPGCGKTTIARIIGELFQTLGLSRHATVHEVQKGDLVVGYVGQTSKQTRKKLKQARGGFLFVDEAYQLTEAAAKGQNDFGGEAIDEMMRVMNDKPGPKTVSFIFAGYKEEMDRFVEYNAGIRSRIKYYFDFDDYKAPELAIILGLKLKGKGYTHEPGLMEAMPKLIEERTDAALLSQYNGRLVDNLLQWAKDELTRRLPMNAAAEELNRFKLQDFVAAFDKIRKPQRKEVPRADRYGMEQLSQLLHRWGLAQMFGPLTERGVVKVTDLLTLRELDLRHNYDLPAGSQLLKRMVTLVRALQQFFMTAATEFPKPQPQSVAAFLRGDQFNPLGLDHLEPLLQKAQVGPEQIFTLSYEDLKEIGINPVGVRRKLFAAIEQEREQWELRMQMHQINPMPGAGGRAIDPIQLALDAIGKESPR